MLRRICLLMGVLVASSVWAQGPGRDDAAYPARHLRLIAPFTGGSTLDIMARVIAEQLTGALGQNVVVDNRPGANGIIGIDLVAKAPADGYTLLMTTGSFTGNLVLNKKLPYDGVRDFAPITQVARYYGMVLLVNTAVPAKSIAQLVALAKSRPGKLSYGSSGMGNITHLVAEMFKAEAGIDIVHVPYKGSATAMTDEVGQQIDMTFLSTVSVQPFIKADRVRALALTGSERTPVLPDLPTFRELGLPGVEMTGWYGLWFPAKTAQARVNRIQSAIRKAVASAEMKARLEEFGLVSVASSPVEFAKFLREDFALQARIVKQAGIEPQ